MVENSYKYNKKILEYCPNFDKIINSDFYEGDKVTYSLIKIYEDFIFSVDLNNKKDIEELREIDTILEKYLSDYHFRGELKKNLLEIKITEEITNIVKYIVERLIEIFHAYKEGYTRNIYIPKWI